MNKKTPTSEQLARLARLATLPDDTIETDDIPEIPETATLDRRRTELYRPVKQPVTIRLDADVIRWFKNHAAGRPYQSEINRVLRQHVAGAAAVVQKEGK